MTPAYDDVGSRSIYQHIQEYGDILNVKHGVQLLYTIPSKFTNNADYEYQ